MLALCIESDVNRTGCGPSTPCRHTAKCPLGVDLAVQVPAGVFQLCCKLVCEPFCVQTDTVCLVDDKVDAAESALRQKVTFNDLECLTGVTVPCSVFVAPPSDKA